LSRSYFFWDATAFQIAVWNPIGIHLESQKKRKEKKREEKRRKEKNRKEIRRKENNLT
jgi:hypothetical protein